MGAPPDIRFGILKCRDLVQLYYGARMVMQAHDGNLAITDSNAHLVLAQDPRRISYELTFCGNNIGTDRVQLGLTFDGVTNNLAEQVFLAAVDTIIITRNFRTEGDAVCQPVWVRALDGEFVVSWRTITLTPIPVDEYP